MFPLSPNASRIGGFLLRKRQIDVGLISPIGPHFARPNRRKTISRAERFSSLSSSRRENYLKFIFVFKVQVIFISKIIKKVDLSSFKVGVELDV
jgi:hypothetical protein